MKQIVQQTELRVEQPSPHHGNSRRSSNHGKEENRSIYGTASHFPVQKHSQNQRDCDGKWHFHDSIFECIKQSLPDIAVTEHFYIIIQSYEFISDSEVSCFIKALLNGPDNGINIQYNQTYDGR